MAEVNVPWRFDVGRSTQQKVGPRLSTNPGTFYEMVGIDGREEGCARPFPGFREVHRFNSIPKDEGLYGKTPYITDCFNFDLTVGESDYAYGFVYRVQRVEGWDEYTGDATSSSSVNSSTPSDSSDSTDDFETFFENGSKADVYLDIWISRTGAWQKGILLANRVNPAEGYEGENPAAQMDVASFGQLGYVFIQGRNPVSFRVDDTDAISIIGGPSEEGVTPGPGPQPTLFSPGSDNVEPGSIVGTGGDISGRGQIFLTDYPPRYLLLGIGDPILREVTSSTNAASAGDDTLESGSTTSTTADDVTYVLEDNPKGQKDSDAARLEPGDYVFAYQLYSSKTGLRSSLSELATVRQEEWEPLNTPIGGSWSAGFTPTQLYAAIEIAWNSAEYDQAFIYRSVKVQDAGGTLVAGILQLDKVIDLADYETEATTSADAVRNSIYYYELNDKALAVQTSYVDNVLHDEQVPYGGAAHIFGNTLLVSNITGKPSGVDEERGDQAFRGVGELRWSSLREVSPELFPASNRYLPESRSSSIISFFPISPYVAGLSKDRTYHIDALAGFLRPKPMHDGHGIVNHRAGASVGNFVYYVTSQGVVALDARNQRDDVRALNFLIREQWKDDLHRVSCAYDPVMKAWCVHNPVKRHSAWLWFKNPSASELYDVPFEHIFEGFWPENYYEDGLYTSPLRRQMMGVWNPGDTPEDDVTIDYKLSEVNQIDAFPAVYSVDYNRTKKDQKVLSSEEKETYTLMEIPLRPWGVLQEQTFSEIDSETWEVDVSLGSNDAETNLQQLLHTYVYFLGDDDEADETWRGRKYRIVGVSRKFNTVPTVLYTLRIRKDENQWPYPEDTDPDEITFGSLGTGAPAIGISPVEVRLVAHKLPISAPTGEVYIGASDYYVRQRADTLVAHFQDLQGDLFGNEDPSTGAVRFFGGLYGMVYRGNETKPSEERASFRRQGRRLANIQEGESIYPIGFGGDGGRRNGVTGSNLVPGIRIFAPSLDYRLMGFMVEGSNLDETRNKLGTRVS